jgi:ribokinase
VCEHDSVTRVAAPTVRAMDTTGAGDAFVGAFAYGLAHGLTAVAAAELGCRCAGVSVTRQGTQTSFPTVDELAELRRELKLNG